MTQPPQWLSASECRLDDLLAVLADGTHLDRYPHADRAVQGVLVYDSAAIAAVMGDPARRRELQAELADALANGPGVVVFAGRVRGRRGRRCGDRRVRRHHRRAACRRAARRATTSASPAPTTGSGTPSRSSRSARPTCSSATTPTTSSRWRRQAWLGPGYQITSQVNVVNPGGLAQARTATTTSASSRTRSPPSSRRTCTPVSPVLTLQGAVAHSDMPVESGPTLLPAALAEVPARLPRVAAARVPRALRGAPRAAAAGQGRRRVLQPRAVPRRRHEPHGRRPTDGEPAAGVVGVRPRDGVDRPRPRRGRRSTTTWCKAHVDRGLGPPGARQRHRGQRRGLRLPDQPRPRPARRRPGAADPGRPRAPGARRRAGTTRRWCARLREQVERTRAT